MVTGRAGRTYIHCAACVRQALALSTSRARPGTGGHRTDRRESVGAESAGLARRVTQLRPSLIVALCQDSAALPSGGPRGSVAGLPVARRSLKRKPPHTASWPSSSYAMDAASVCKNAFNLALLHVAQYT